MAILTSDDGAGLGTSVLTGRTANNGLGGTVSPTWVTPTGGNQFSGDGSGGFTSSNTAAINTLSVTGANKARVRFNATGAATNIAIWGRKDNDPIASADGVLILLVGYTSLRASSIAAGSRTDHATTSITDPAAPCWLEIEVNGLVLTGRVLNNDTSVRNTVTHTFGGSVPSGGDHWGFSLYLDNNAVTFDDFIVEDGAAGAQTLTPPLLTNTPTLYAPAVALRGVTAAYVLANTGAVGANPQGFMYDIAGLVSPGDYMTYTTVSGPTPGGGTLVEYVDGRFEYTGGAPAVWVVQVKINGSNYFETTTVYLYDQLFTLLPSLFTNSQTFYTPTVTRGVGTQTLSPSLVTNSQTFFGPSIVRGTVVLSPALFTNTQIFYRPTITGGIPAPTPAEGAPNNGEAMRSCMRPAMYPAMNQG